jgi:bacterioferritin
MAQPTKEQIIAMLNEDIKGEHAAIIQYLRHAYAMGEGELACEIEAIAREEMYHYKWLSDLVVELGGKPTIERGNLDRGGNEVADWMYRDVRLEQEAIDLYQKHIALIDDPKIVRVLERIMSDEESHQGDFEHFVDKATREMPGGDGLPPETPPPAPAQETAAILNRGVRHEYTVVLQYLFHAFLTPDRKIGEELHWQAVNEMQHMGWLAEEVIGLGSEADTEHTEVDLSEDTVAMLKADIAAERAVTMDYEAQMEAIEDEGLNELLARIRDHEIYHDELFSEMLEELESKNAPEPVQETPEGSEPSSDVPSVGSLVEE